MTESFPKWMRLQGRMMKAFMLPYGNREAYISTKELSEKRGACG